MIFEAVGADQVLDRLHDARRGARGVRSLRGPRVGRVRADPRPVAHRTDSELPPTAPVEDGGGLRGRRPAVPALQRTPDFDPTAWLIWGRELSDGTLSTLGGPSWKPLPVLFTTLFAPAGDTVAPWLWLVVARTGGLLALVAPYRLTGASAAACPPGSPLAALVLATDFLYNSARGDSEGLLVALACGRSTCTWPAAGTPPWPPAGRRAAAPRGLAAAAAYAAWLMWSERRWRTLALLGGRGPADPRRLVRPRARRLRRLAARAATRGPEPGSGSPGQSALPFLVTFGNGAIALALPVYGGAVWAVVHAIRTRPRSSASWTVLVARRRLDGAHGDCRRRSPRTASPATCAT